jgi:hypothetical protein
MAWLGCFVQAPAISITEMDPDDSAGSSRDPSARHGALVVQAAGMRGQTLARVSQHWYSLEASQRDGAVHGLARCSLTIGDGSREWQGAW